MTYVVISKIKELVKEQDCNMAGAVPDKLDEAIKTLIVSACNRAKANGRKTLQEKDV